MVNEFLHYYVQRARIYRNEAQRAITYTTLEEPERAEIIRKTLLRSVDAELANLSTEIVDYANLLKDIQAFSKNKKNLVEQLTFIRGNCQLFIAKHTEEK
ncbi:hypothetical protein LB941_05440 [Ligilactobacillus sp. WILCCON 0076]|uniref:Uncharacterized protein n=1 Tax=Ligilactobacillus ubinensis TaxID=2876789 RepID=A0A9X2FJE1_9LACO|nr:hypothetical protein [Ligilactobacillus ubinensis]MCP0886781.1 hypothetical protein [Ligilactobacillus ubinensis]